jgi:hypothetical protein
VAILLGIAVWVVAIRYVVPVAADEFTTLGPVVHAVMATGVLGTVLNDAGIAVWLVVSVTLISPLAWFWADARLADRRFPTYTRETSTGPAKLRR